MDKYTVTVESLDRTALKRYVMTTNSTVDRSDQER